LSSPFDPRFPADSKMRVVAGLRLAACFSSLSLVKSEDPLDSNLTCDASGCFALGISFTDDAIDSDLLMNDTVGPELMMQALGVAPSGNPLVESLPSSSHTAIADSIGTLEASAKVESLPSSSYIATADSIGTLKTSAKVGLLPNHTETADSIGTLATSVKALANVLKMWSADAVPAPNVSDEVEEADIWAAALAAARADALRQARADFLSDRSQAIGAKADEAVVAQAGEPSNSSEGLIFAEELQTELPAPEVGQVASRKAHQDAPPAARTDSSSSWSVVEVSARVPDAMGQIRQLKLAAAQAIVADAAPADAQVDHPMRQAIVADAAPADVVNGVGEPALADSVGRPMRQVDPSHAPAPAIAANTAAPAMHAGIVAANSAPAAPSRVDSSPAAPAIVANTAAPAMHAGAVPAASALATPIRVSAPAVAASRVEHAPAAPIRVSAPTAMHAGAEAAVSAPAAPSHVESVSSNQAPAEAASSQEPASGAESAVGSAPAQPPAIDGAMDPDSASEVPGDVKPIVPAELSAEAVVPEEPAPMPAGVVAWLLKHLKRSGAVPEELKGASTKGAAGAACEEYPSCVVLGLSGECCPTPDGVSLWCCSSA